METKQYSILYVDDEEANLRVFTSCFRMDYKIFTTTTGEEGLEILKREDIDLIISDQKMPNMSGVEFFEKAIEIKPGPNRILLTAYSEFEIIKEAINRGKIYEYVSKPWDVGKLKLIIDSSIESYKLKEENKTLNEKLLQQTIELKKDVQEKNTLLKNLQKSQEELIASKQKAEESNRLKTEFFNNMSHEIRTPMNGILGFSDFLNDSNLSESKRKYYVSIIQNSGKQLMRIIDDILEMSVLETKQVTVRETQVCLNDLLLEQFSIFDIKAKENDISFYVNNKLSDAESTIITDETKLIKVISNLLENAFKYTNSGSVELGYHLVGDKNSKEIHIYVKDTGVGIKPENLKTIFDRFSQEEKELSRKTGGLGLGLSIAKENIELLKGKISVESVKGKGSTFTISLKYNPVNGVVKQEEDDLDNVEKSRPENGYKVIIAEDEEVNFLFLDMLMNKFKPEFNFNILHAKNGKEAVEYCEKSSDIDLVLMDLRMPILNGIEATEIIVEKYPDIPVVAQTAFSTVEDKEKALTAGCVDFISKPINKDKLKEILNRFLVKSD